jgi:hypothetical protein
MRYLRCYAARRMHAQVKSVNLRCDSLICAAINWILDERKILNESPRLGSTMRAHLKDSRVASIQMS